MGYKFTENDDMYKGFKLIRVNHNCGRPTISIVVKYGIKYKGITIYFKTQKEVTDFIDKITE